jgi:sodium/potassium-transporting ATPase subunit beta
MATNRSKSVTSHHADAPQLLGGTAIKPIERHGWEKIRYFLHNPETGAFLSRTPKSWFLIFLFYCIYYSCLAGFWYGMLQIFFLTLNDDTPKWMKEESIIGINPGMGVRPRQADARIDSSMYYFQGNWNGEKTTDLEQDSDAGFAARMEDFLNKTLVEGQKDASLCDATELNKPREKNQPPCKFEVSQFGQCGNFPYGYSKDSGIKPCVIVKLNKIFGLVPEPYQPEDAEGLNDVPDKIKRLIKDINEPRRVYIECHGENAADEEALSDIKYFPDHQGVPMGYFPHQVKTNLVSPAVAVQFTDVPRGQLVHVECKAWFKGVVHERKERMGLVHFELLVNH